LTKDFRECLIDRSIDRCPFTVWSLHHCFGGGHPLVSGWVVNFFFFWESTSTMLLHCIVLFFFVVWFVRIYTFCCWIVRWSVQNDFLVSCLSGVFLIFAAALLMDGATSSVVLTQFGVCWRVVTE
jgi:hypothetical protein